MDFQLSLVTVGGISTGVIGILKPVCNYIVTHSAEIDNE